MGPWASRDGTGASSTSGWRPPGTPIDRLCLDVCLLRESSVARTSSFDSTENCSVRSRPIVFWLSRHPGGHAEHSALILVQGASRVSPRRSATCACPRRQWRAECDIHGGPASASRGMRHPRGPDVSFARSATWAASAGGGMRPPFGTGLGARGKTPGWGPCVTEASDQVASHSAPV